MNDSINATGSLHIVVKDQNGNVVHDSVQRNLVVAVGRAFITARMTGTADAVMSHMAVGTNNTTPVAGDTTLGTELERVALGSITPFSNTVTYAANYPAGTGTGALVEAGIFNASSAGTMLARTVFATVNKGAGDTMDISWTITVG